MAKRQNLKDKHLYINVVIDHLQWLSNYEFIQYTTNMYNCSRIFSHSLWHQRKLFFSLHFAYQAQIYQAKANS